MDTTIRKVSLRARIVAVLLAALMVLGLSFFGATNLAGADPTEPAAEPAGVGIQPTGNEMIDNPEEAYPSVPRGGLFRFEGKGFVPGSSIYITISQTGGTTYQVGTYDIDNDAAGYVLPVISTEPYPSFIVPTGAAVDAAILTVYYSDGTLATQLAINVLDNPYGAAFSIYRDLSGNRWLEVTNTTEFAHEATISLKIDYLETPIWGQFTTDKNGDFSERILLDNRPGFPTLAPGLHTFTLLAFDHPPFPRASVSQNLTL